MEKIEEITAEEVLEQYSDENQPAAQDEGELETVEDNEEKEV